MTTDGRPELKGTEEFLHKTYAQQRKARLQDAVDDYLQDDEATIVAFYDDLKACIQDIITYHKRSTDRAQAALDLVHGHRPKFGIDGLDQTDITRTMNDIQSTMEGDVPHHGMGNYENIPPRY